MVDVFGPVSGFPLGDITTPFRLTVSQSGQYSVGVEFKQVEDGSVVGSSVFNVNVEDETSGVEVNAELTYTETPKTLTMASVDGKPAFVLLNYYENDDTEVHAYGKLFIGYSLNADELVKTFTGEEINNGLMIGIVNGTEPTGDIVARYKLVDGVLTELELLPPYVPPTADTTNITNLIPETDPDGNALPEGAVGTNLTDPSLGTFTFEFTTGSDTQYDLYAVSNNHSHLEEAVVSLKKADGTVIDISSILTDVNGGALEEGFTPLYTNESGELKFAPGIMGVKAGIITLEQNTTYTLVSTTAYNDGGDGDDRIDIGIKLEGAESGLLDINYVKYG